MAAVLLNWSAKPEKAERLAEALAAKEAGRSLRSLHTPASPLPLAQAAPLSPQGHKLQAKAKDILKFMSDPKACTEHVETVVDAKIKEANDRDFRLGCQIAIVGLGLWAIYWFVFKPMGNLGEL